MHVPRDADAGAAYELLRRSGGRQPAGARWPPWPTARRLAAAEGEADLRRQDHRGRPRDRLARGRRRRSPTRCGPCRPTIGAHTELGGRRVRSGGRAARRPLAGRRGRATAWSCPAGAGLLEILELQEAGRRRMTAQEYLRGAGRRWRRSVDRRARRGGGAGAPRRLRVLWREAARRGRLRRCAATRPEFGASSERDRGLAYELVMGTDQAAQLARRGDRRLLEAPRSATPAPDVRESLRLGASSSSTSTACRRTPP